MPKEFPKNELLRLSGLTASDHTFLVRSDLLHASNPITRGMTPLYERDEVLVALLMERLHRAGMVFAQARAVADTVLRNWTGRDSLLDVEDDETVWMWVYSSGEEGQSTSHGLGFCRSSRPGDSIAGDIEKWMTRPAETHPKQVLLLELGDELRALRRACEG